MLLHCTVDVLCYTVDVLLNCWCVFYIDDVLCYTVDVLLHCWCVCYVCTLLMCWAVLPSVNHNIAFHTSSLLSEVPSTSSIDWAISSIRWRKSWFLVRVWERKKATYLYNPLYSHERIKVRSASIGYIQLTASFLKLGAWWQLNSAFKAFIRSQSLNSVPFWKIAGSGREGPKVGTSSLAATATL